MADGASAARRRNVGGGGQNIGGGGSAAGADYYRGIAVYCPVNVHIWYYSRTFSLEVSWTICGTVTAKERR